MGERERGREGERERGRERKRERGRERKREREGGKGRDPWGAATSGAPWLHSAAAARAAFVRNGRRS